MTQRSRRQLARLILISSAFVATGCASTTVNKILADPARYRDRDVRLSGSVVDSYSFANRGAYKIDDKTGQLWVVSDRGVPRRGARVKVKGTIQQGLSLGSFGDRVRVPPALGSGLVMIESDRNARE